MTTLLLRNIETPLYFVFKIKILQLISNELVITTPSILFW